MRKKQRNERRTEKKKKRKNREGDRKRDAEGDDVDEIRVRWIGVTESHPQHSIDRVELCVAATA